MGANRGICSYSGKSLSALEESTTRWRPCARGLCTETRAVFRQRAPSHGGSRSKQYFVNTAMAQKFVKGAPLRDSLHQVNIDIVPSWDRTSSSGQDGWCSTTRDVSQSRVSVSPGECATTGGAVESFAHRRWSRCPAFRERCKNIEWAYGK